ncbi:MAG TPA: phosphatase PAP2 family protein [Bacteroidia bacterium]|jgi:membrane-associated phospholipid phosphatase|nr:phosphatase PAP2 family protein [Bacteroidia bacterium]
MLRFLANFFSLVFNPLMAPTALFYIILYHFPQIGGIGNDQAKMKAIGFIFATTFLFAFVLIYILYKLRMISKITLDDQKDRYIPQLVLSIVYMLLAMFLGFRLGWGNGLTLTMVATTISAGVITGVNRFWKISTHASGVAGVYAICTALILLYPGCPFRTPYICISFITIAVCASRLYLKAHTPMQIVCGFLVGGISGFALFYFHG